ncbi:protein sidekick homolog [Anableps anableps]
MMLVESVIFAVIFLLTTGARCEVIELIGETGSQVVLPCKCEASQCDPAAITWSKDNKGTVWRKQSNGLQYWGSNWFKKEGSRVRCPHTEFAKGDYSLQINRLKEEDAGLYTCKVELRGHLTEKRVMLRILQGIIQPPKQDTKLYAALGSSFTMPCVFSPELSPTEILVEKLDSGVQIFNNRSVSSSSWDKSIIIQEVVPENEGKYRCGGTIEGRRLTQTMQLVVAKIVKSKMKESTMLSCQLSDSSEVTKYEWVHVSYDINGTELVGAIQYGQTISVKENFGEWTCRYFGLDGLLGNVTLQVHLIGGLSGEKSSGVSSNTSTVIGLSFLLVILVLILAQMYKNYRRKRRILQYPALETIVHTISNEREERERDRVKK